MSFVHSVRKALAKLRYPTVDANGNLNANVNLRTGTLAQLLAVTNAGIGEMAVPTDVKGTVVYNADITNPTQSRGFFMPMGGYNSYAGCVMATGAVTSGTAVGISGVGTESRAGLVDTANNRIALPEEMAYLDPQGVYTVNLDLRWNLFLMLGAANVEVSATVEWSSDGVTWGGNGAVDTQFKAINTSSTTLIAVGNGQYRIEGTTGSLPQSARYIRPVLQFSGTTVSIFVAQLAVECTISA